MTKQLEINPDTLRPGVIADLIRVFSAARESEYMDERIDSIDGLLTSLRELYYDLTDEPVETATEIVPMVHLELGLAGLKKYTSYSHDEELSDAGAVRGNIDPRLVGHLIRQYLPLKGEPLTREQKLFWLDVDEHVGDDYESVKLPGDFLKRFNEFK